MQVCKDVGIVSAGTPDERQLEKINALAKSALTAQEVYAFRVRLCDDQPDRDFERFDTDALPLLAEFFRGKTGIADHNWSAERQIARIFDTGVCTENGVHYIRADCYMLRTEKNADLISEIEGGIKKEVSVGCAMAKATCSICGEPYGSCVHHKGAVYDGAVCLAVLSEPTDAYEFSFVAVPAQKQAGVVKGAKGGRYFMTLKELVAQQGSPALADSLKTLESEAEFGRVCRKKLVDEAVSLGLLLDFGAEEGVMRKAFSALEATELAALKDTMARKAAALFPPQSQLPRANATPNGIDDAFII